MRDDLLTIADDVVLGSGTRFGPYVNLYGCVIGDGCTIGSFVEIQSNASVGDRCKISSHTFICEGVTIADECFVGHGVMFINDNQPRATTPDGQREEQEDWAPRFVRTSVEKGASIGSNATILGGITIGRQAVVGAGSVVTRDVPAGEVWVGNPARKLKERSDL